MRRITRGLRLIGISWDVLRRDRELMLLPIISFIAVVVATTPIGFGLWRAGALDPGVERTPLHYAALFVTYVVSYFIVIFFNAALVGAAMIRLDGGNPTLRDGLRMAAERIDKILAWAVVAATVGMAFRMIEERAGTFGRILVQILNVAWGAVTYFVLPVMVFEQAGVGTSMRRSATLFRQRWGETFVGAGAIGLATALVAVPVIIAVIAITMAVPIVGLVVGVVTLGFLFSFSAALSGIFNAALYRYAVAGDVLGGFSEGDLRSAFRPGRGRASRRSTLAPADPFEAGGPFGDLDPELKARVKERLKGEHPAPTDPATPMQTSSEQNGPATDPGGPSAS